MCDGPVRGRAQRKGLRVKVSTRKSHQRTIPKDATGSGSWWRRRKVKWGPQRCAREGTQVAQNNTVKENPGEATTLGKYEPETAEAKEKDFTGLAPHLEINTSNGSCCEERTV